MLNLTEADDQGRIVNVISNCTECPLPTLGPYTASKAALLALSDAMRPELARTGVKVITEISEITLMMMMTVFRL